MADFVVSGARHRMEDLRNHMTDDIWSIRNPMFLDLNILINHRFLSLFNRTYSIHIWETGNLFKITR